jgi:hypothetical protein
MTASPHVLRDRASIQATVNQALADQPIIDMHTHLYPPTFGTPDPNPTGTDPTGLLLWGVDELLTYHYLVAEVFRVVPATQLSYDQFWQMSKSQQADHIWKHLFIERSPVSEACRGVLTCLQMLGLDTSTRDLVSYRKWCGEQDPSDYIDRIMQAANVESITMTNAVFDDNERQRWLADESVGNDSRFAGVLRFDPILRNWPEAAKKLSDWGYQTSEELTDQTISEVQRFLREWIDKVKAVYCAVSLPPDFRYPAANPDDPIERAGQTVLERCVLPVCEERGLPFAMMIGSRLRVNPALGDAGDMVGKSDVLSVVNLCRQFPKNKFFCTMLARENQHELCVAARKFGNLMVFGCWWFLNNPSLIDEMTRMRLELLGTSVIPQHSDARVLDQLTYKWEHSRRLIAPVLTDKYTDLAATGWQVTAEEIRRDVRLLLHDNFVEFCKR